MIFLFAVACVDTQDTCEADISYCTDDVWRAELERDCPVTCGVCSKYYVLSVSYVLLWKVIMEGLV